MATADAADSAATVIERREWILQPQTEYRFELDAGTSLAIKLVHGFAEVFGLELAEGKPYLFGSESKAAVFSWQGCTIEVIGKPSTEYVSEETPMGPYGNLHIALEQMRVKALRDLHGSPRPEDEPERPNPPPRIMIIGPDNYGKTTVTKMLANYAVGAGQGWTPVLVNLDPGDGGWTAPGTLSAAPLDSPIPTSSPATTLGSAATSAPMALSSHALVPLVYWFGHAEARRNVLLYERLIGNLARDTLDKLHADPEGAVGGVLIDTPSSFATGPAEERQRLVKCVVDAFDVNVILVVGHEKLNVEMQRLFPPSTHSNITIVKIPKSGGVVELDSAYRERVQNCQLHTYFYGQVIPAPKGTSSTASSGGELLHDLVLAPSSTIVTFDDIKIYRIGAESMAPSSALPIGASRVLSEMQPVLIDPTQPGSGLLNAVAAIVAFPPENPNTTEGTHLEENQLIDTTVAGFIVITQVDIPNRKFTVLTPNTSSIVGRTAIVGTFEWSDI
ncbi:Pre-mRNA cleavage complex II protein Clp1-domain-containing protein [Flagelloscypha sp. PMI_526]|nr:Pre-mRNA cleavage complex II protein Clp1-domain-containing protein [Flagelloscypha sp. PMI_526]